MMKSRSMLALSLLGLFCFETIVWFNTGHFFWANYRESNILRLQARCYTGTVDVCNSAASYSKGDTRLGMWRRGCDGGEYSDCESLAFQYQKGRGTKVDLARAATLYRVACRGESSAGCHELAMMHEKGEGMAADRDAAFELHEKACRLSHTDACTDACSLGSAVGCAGLGALLDRGHGGPSFREKARLVFGRACVAGVTAACARTR